MTNRPPGHPLADPRIIGFWKGVGGDYGLINEFRLDGTVIQHVGDRSSKPSPFRTEGDYIIYSLEHPNGSVFEQKTQYLISEDTLTFIYPPRKKMHFRRVQEA